MSDFDDAARAVAQVWDGLNGGQRRMVNEHVGHDLYRALHALTGAGTWDDRDAPEAEAPEPPREYPAEKRVADLEKFLADQHRRADALHHARKSWGGTMSEDPDRHARNVTTIAAAFDRFLADGTVHEVPDAPQEGEADPVGEPIVTHQPLADMVRGIKHAPKILAAALQWVDESHTNNLGGPENWRNWADDKDVNLINAVLAYRGLPPLERKPM